MNTSVDRDISTQTLSLLSMMVSGRKYLPESTLQSEIRPYLTLGMGTLIGTITESRVGSTISADVGTMGALAGQIGGGLDMQVGRHFMLDTKAAYNLVSDFEEPFAGRKNYSGVEVSIGLNFLFG